MIPIRDYREFYDVPRVFLVDWAGKSLLFDCLFDEELDDYPDSYTVYQVAAISPWESERAWPSPKDLGGRRIGKIPVSRVHFDSTRRSSIDSAVLDELNLGMAA
jgi:hypothetical protein